MKQRTRPGLCPICSGPMHIAELQCDQCGTTLRSRFETCALCQLPDEMYDFLMVFIRTRGSIKEMERELGISYPTVRSRMDELLRMLGFQTTESETSVKAVLDMLERGEITAEEAEAMLRNR